MSNSKDHAEDVHVEMPLDVHAEMPLLLVDRLVDGHTIVISKSTPDILGCASLCMGQHAEDLDA